MTQIKAFLRPVPLPAPASFALLVVRLIVGVAFVLHGWGKMQSPMSWMGPESPVPGVLQFLAAFSEFGGGIALVLGLLTSVASLGLLITMTVAVCMHKFMLGDPFVNTTGGRSYELALVFWGIALLLMLLGAGRFSADAKVFGQRS